MVKNALVFLFFLGLTILVSWPLALHLNEFIIDRFDGLLITWILNWQIHSLSSGLSGIFNFYNANIFYPYQNTLAFSETMLLQAIFASPFVLIFKEPLLAYNINFLTGFTLTGFTLFLLVRKLTGRQPVSFLAAVLFTFSTIHLNYMAHLQLFNFWPVILAVYFLLGKRYKAFILFFLMSVLTSVLFLYFLLLLVAILAFLERKRFWALVKVAGVAILASVPFLAPYFLVSRQFNYVRPITDAIHFSLQLPDLANVSIYSRLSTFFTQNPGTPAYFGLAFLFLLIIFFKDFVAQKTASRILKFFLLSSFFSLILSLGPALHVFRDTVHIGPIPAIPLPYAILYYVLPGFSGMRTPSRWILLTAFALAVAIAVYLARRITWGWAVILSLLVILEVNSPFQYTRVPPVSEFPPEQVWLKENFTGAPIIQFPIYGWFDPSTRFARWRQALDGVGLETLRMYYSTVGWHPMFNGYSGFSPKEWEEKVKWLQKSFPSDETVGYLRNLGIKLVLLPVDWDVSSVQNELELVKSFPQTNVYAINSRFDQR